MELGGIILIILGIMFGPPFLLVVIGISKRNENPDTAKKLYICAAVYVLVSCGICASMMFGL
jgi:hypothetical protein